MENNNENRDWGNKWILTTPIFSGSLSAISSALIIFIILRSQTKLSTIYHRIMFGMSLADLLSSISIALSTLPMPSSMPKEDEYLYSWGGTRIGNIYTCNAQGFFVSFGMSCTFGYNVMLCVYYACAIAFIMQEHTIKKYVEPIIHGLPILVGLVPSLFYLFAEMYNPQIGNFVPQASWCSISRYPMHCDDDVVECIRGFDASKTVLIKSAVMSPFGLFIIVISLSLVLRKVIQTEKIFCQNIMQSILHTLEFDDIVANTKMILTQAVFYVVAFLICVSPPFINIIAIYNNASQSVLKKCLLATHLLLPLQGFFNFIIFMVHKVYNYRRVNKAATIRHVIWLLFFTAAHEPCFISRISILRHQEDSFHDDNDNYESVEKEKIIDILTDDEGCSETMRYRLRIMSNGLEMVDNIDSSGSGSNGDKNDAGGGGDGGQSSMTHSYTSPRSNIVDKNCMSSSGISFGSADDGISYPSASPFSMNGEMFAPYSTGR